ncbi:uncharacterized protein QC761_0024610 [Podospora bellae-mahoneyi]|uniref:Uncharacterized protein n=1 Tax=Podospora bellae-mahoneyi TaxID=2093777 RepID=A0ABR0FSV8_9PEZI|nr:hypothetical protein QC761_0024610 [Podospora bellae-mahoneyi]
MSTRYIAEVDQSRRTATSCAILPPLHERSVDYDIRTQLGHRDTLPGSAVTYTGSWQKCDLGASYTLDQNGDWSAKQDNPNAKSDSLNVASNDYAVAVHIIVMYKTLFQKKWTPPIETVNIWYQQGGQTATMISNQATSVQPYEMPAARPVYFII